MISSDFVGRIFEIECCIDESQENQKGIITSSGNIEKVGNIFRFICLGYERIAIDSQTECIKLLEWFREGSSNWE